MKHRNIIIIDKMIKYAEEALSFSDKFSSDEFQGERKTIAACVFNLSQIGEIVKHIDKNITDKYSNIEWKLIKNLRNKIVHDYEGIQLGRIWQILKEDLPQLIIDLKVIIEKES